MKSSQSLDTDIALKIMGQKTDDPAKIPKFSSDIYAAHSVINALQMQGWSCRVRSQINHLGQLSYKAHFNKGKKLHSETIALTIPLAVCLSALAIINKQYVEFVDDHEDDSAPLEIAEPLSELGLEEINIEDEPIVDLLAHAMKERDLPFKDKEGNRQTFERLFFKLVIGGFMNRDDQGIIAKTISGFFLDILKKNSYLIVKKVDDSK